MNDNNINEEVTTTTTSGENNNNSNNNIEIDTERDDVFSKKFGIKSIGTIGGICLLIGNCTGPGMVNISYQFQQGGWLLSILGYIFMLGLSGLSALFIVEAMSLMPGNNKFKLRVEFTMVCRFYFGKGMYILSQIFINSSLIITNIASIIICSQVADSLFIFVFKKTCGISFTNGPICISSSTVVDNIASSLSPEASSPFSNEYMFITLGYISIIILVVPLGFLNLNDNIIIQIICVIIMFAIVISWFVIFIIIGLDVNRLPTIGLSMNGISTIIGNSMFNYAYITTIPSWVNESKPTVNIKKSIWISTGFSTILFILVGIFGAMAFSYPISKESTILSLINQSNSANIISKISVYLFPFIVLASTIPVFSIIVRYNLTQNKFLPTWIANIISIILPWLIVIPFQTGDWLNVISNYSSLFFASIANFIIPFLLYLKSIQFKKSLKFTNELKNLQNNNTDPSTLNSGISSANTSTSSLSSLISSDQKNILKELSFETIDHEENTLIVGSHFKSLSISHKHSKIIAQIALILLIILIILVIFSNFYFND